MATPEKPKLTFAQAIAALDMALAPSDEEAKRPLFREPKHAPPGFDLSEDTAGEHHEHKFTDERDYYGSLGSTAGQYRVCAICGVSEPVLPAPRTQEIRVVKPEHQHLVKRCPCGGEAKRDGVAPWVCAKCARKLFDWELADPVVPAPAPEPATPVAALAEAYGRAKVRAMQAKQREDELNRQLGIALNETIASRKDAELALDLLELSVTEELASKASADRK